MSNAIGCTVLIDGEEISDGCSPFPADDPAVLAGLRVTWGRDTAVDQPQPSSCVFTIDDPVSGSRIVPTLTIGKRVDVRVDTVVYPEPDQGTIPAMLPHWAVDAVATIIDAKHVRLVSAVRFAPPVAASVTFPPLNPSLDPLAWDSVPRTLPGQAWRLKAGVTLPAPFAGYSGWRASLQPRAFTDPSGAGMTLLGEPVAFVGGVADFTFTPPPAVWLGADVRVFPTGPAWDELDATSWADLAEPGAPRSNYIHSPRAALVSEFETLTTSGTLAIVPGFSGYATAAQVTRKVAATGMRLSAVAEFPVDSTVAITVQLLASHDLDAVKFNIRPEVTNSSGATNGPQNIFLVAGVPKTVTFTMRTPTYIGVRPGMAIVLTSGPVGSTLAVTGLQMELDTAGTFFDGDSPDTSTVDYSWKGAANQSTSVATTMGRNRATNPRAVAAGADGWVSTRGFGGGGAGTYSYLTGAAGPAGSGITTARRKTWTTASFNNAASGFQLQDTSALNFPATADTQYTAAVWMRYSAATRKRLQIAVQPTATTAAGSANVGALLSSPIVIPLDGDNGWQRLVYSFRVPVGATGFRLFADVNQGGSTGNSPWLVGDTLDATGLMIVAGNVPAPAYFDGDTPDAPPLHYAWTGTANASASTSSTGNNDGRTWEALGTAVAADLDMLAPAAGAANSAYVFSGRITDLVTQWDGFSDTVAIDVIAQDWLAELANRPVGDTPWAMEPLGTRAQRIVSLSGQPIALTVDPTIAALPVTYRDVDRQPAATLLDQLAISAAGVLWTATHPVTGEVMRLEDPAARPAAKTLTTAEPVRVISSAAAAANSIPITACDLEADPARLVLDTTGTVSQVDLGWKEQTIVDGQQRPTDRTVTMVDLGLQAQIGARRLAVSTQLAALPDAQRIAAVYLARSSNLAWRIAGLRWNTGDDLMSPDDVATALLLLDGTRRIGLPLMITDLPAWMEPLVGATDLALYLEGGVYRYQDGAWIIEIITTSATASATGNFPWNAAPAAWAWADFDPSVRWFDLYGVTYPDV